MEIETTISFQSELFELFGDRIFQRTLILWLTYVKKLNPCKISGETGFNRQRVSDVLNKWKHEGTVEDLPRPGRPRETTAEIEEAIIDK